MKFAKTNALLQPFRRLAVSLAATAVLAEPMVGAALPALSTETRSPNRQTDFNALVEEAIKLGESRNFAAATAAWEKIVIAVEEVTGSDHVKLADALSSLAISYQNQGAYSKAEACLLRALKIREKILGPSHPDAIEILESLANLYNLKGEYLKAEKAYNQAIEAREKAPGTSLVQMADMLNSMAFLYDDQGRTDMAEKSFHRALALAEAAGSPGQVVAGVILFNLATLYHRLGELGKSERLFLRALSIRENSLPPDQEYINVTLNNLALLYADQGRTEKAETLYLRIIQSYEKTQNTNSREYAAVLNNLGDIYRAQGRYEKAERLFLSAIEVDEKLSPSTESVAGEPLNNLGFIYEARGQAEKAKKFYLRALAIVERVKGADHPNAAFVHDNLASVQTDAKEKEWHLRKSLSIREKSLPQAHPGIATSLNNLSSYKLSVGQYKQSHDLLKRGLEIEYQWLTRELPLQSESNRFVQLRSLGRTWLVPFALAVKHPEYKNLAFTTRLNRHGLSQEIERIQALLLSTSSSKEEKVAQLRELTQRLASVSLDGEHRTAIRGQLEKLKSEVFGSQLGFQIREVSAQEVAKSLPVNGVLVEFQRLQTLDINQPFGKRWGEEHYVALVLKPNGVINVVPIGPAKEIDAAVHKGLEAIAERYNDVDKTLIKLSNLVLAPLLPYLKSSRQWFLSPDGELHRVPFAALPAPQKTDVPLAEAVELRLLTTGRDLIRLQESNSGNEPSLVMANPSYDSRSPGRNPASPDSKAPLAQRRSADIGSTQWRALPATEQEGQLVAQLISARLLTGVAAATPALQLQQSPQVLHVATHGFFIADQEANPSDPLNAVQERASQLRPLRQEDPQLRSGIVLAGANQPDADPNDDGYLTAAEAVMLNLKGTELVVFSACSTGQGEIRSGEGVYGLQRSLAVAGARSTLLSLWKVDDTATAAFMESFYRRLKAGASRSNALAAVQAEFRNHSIPAWRDPYYWGAWQLVGDWRPIKGL